MAAPITWTAALVSVADMNGQIRDNLIPTRCILSKSSSQTLSNNVDTAITFGVGTEITDPSGLHNTGSNTSRIVLTSVGVWLVAGSITYDSSSTGSRSIWFRRNADSSEFLMWQSHEPVSTAFATAVSACAFFVSALGTDYVELFGSQDSGGSLDVTDAQFSAVFLGWA